jgi:hypothetical protein
VTEICFDGGKGTMSLGADGILRLVWNRDATVELADAREAINAGNLLAGGRRLPLLAEFNGVHLTARALQHAQKHGTTVVASVAAVGVTSADRVLGAWLWRHETFPQAYFSTRERALAWLAGLPHGNDVEARVLQQVQVRPAGLGGNVRPRPDAMAPRSAADLFRSGTSE